ncbi:MAG: hypothetical protein Q9199_003069 [Rusavskia elegans]
MKEYRLKYGFLTTYKETIFFKQEILTFDNELASINQISDKMSGLSIEEVRIEKARLLSLPKFKVHWDGRYGTYLCTVDGKVGRVAKHEIRHGVLLVKILNKPYHGIVV